MRARDEAAAALGADWLGACRRATAALEELLATQVSVSERFATVGLGAGGDRTLAIDQAAEEAIFVELDRLHGEGHAFTAIAEERGEVVFGDGSSPVKVVIDPIDGSLNAKRRIPAHSVSIAVAAGETMEDVAFAFVHDFGVGEEYVARLGAGATLNGEPIGEATRDAELEVVGLESARPEWIAPVAERLSGSVYRVRALGSIAITLCYVAACRFDGMVTANTCRSVDAAAAQLIAREADAFVSVLGQGGLEAPLDLDARFRIAAARTPEGLETLVRALTDAGLPPERS